MADKSINQILIDVQEDKPLSEREMRLALESMRTIEHYLKRHIQSIVKAHRDKSPLLAFKISEAERFADRLSGIMKDTPEKWLGADNIPGTEAYRQRLSWAKNLFKTATGQDF